ncbi:hypothetical protein [Cupriavidus sp. CuC1]|uniref:hypothetical protein n=1 Tax=Cupriavidus sp. CuC1 TaxID=3373131 RepID=UPI0037D4ECC3
MTESVHLLHTNVVGLLPGEPWGAGIRRLARHIVWVSDPDADWFREMEGAKDRPLLPHGVQRSAAVLAKFVGAIAPIARRATILNWIEPWLPEPLRPVLEDYINNHGGTGCIWQRTGFGHMRSVNRVRHGSCEECRHRQLEDLGESAWLMRWALPGYEICLEHDEIIGRWCADCHQRYQSSPYPVLPGVTCPCGKPLRPWRRVNEGSLDLFRRIARDVEDVLAGKLAPFSSDLIQQCLREKAVKAGLTGNGGTRRAREFLLDTRADVILDVDFGVHRNAALAAVQGECLSPRVLDNVCALSGHFGSIEAAVAALQRASKSVALPREENVSQRIEVMRPVICGVIDRNPDLDEIGLEKALVAELALVRNLDREWLHAQFADRRARRESVRQVEADERFEASVLQRLQALEQDGLDRRRTPKHIARDVVEVDYVRTNRAKLPRTYAAIFGNVESPRSYAVRLYTALVHKGPSRVRPYMHTDDKRIRRTPTATLLQWIKCLKARLKASAG